MKFGLFLMAQHPRGESMAAHLDEHLEQVRLARRLGFDSVWAGQHYVSRPYQMLQTVPFLARVAGEADGMLIGTGIILLALANPVDLAEQIASLDIIARGRFVFGVGLGYRTEEYEALGVAPASKVTRFTEALDVVKRLWTDDEITFEGRHFTFRSVRPTLRPLQRPHPPIWIAANGDEAIRRAARLGDAWMVNPHAKAETLRRQLALYREALAACGKAFPAELPMIREACLASDRAAARAAAARYLGEKYRSYLSWGQDRALPDSDPLDLPWEALTAERFIVGDAALCRRHIERYAELLGVNHFIFRVQWPGMPQAMVLESLRLLGEEVIQAFR